MFRDNILPLEKFSQHLYATANTADVDECNNLEKYPCSVKGTCKNTKGGFQCICPPNYPKGNAYNGTCEKDQSIPLKVTIPIGTALMMSHLHHSFTFVKP